MYVYPTHDYIKISRHQLSISWSQITRRQ